VIPSLALVRVGAIRLWLPLFLLWPLMLPFAVLFVVAALIVARAYGVAATALLRTAWQFATGWRGADIEVDTAEVAFQVRFI
jgi:hypothetical protein